jgi:hypothetical protein
MWLGQFHSGISSSAWRPTIQPRSQQRPCCLLSWLVLQVTRPPLRRPALRSDGGAEAGITVAAIAVERCLTPTSFQRCVTPAGCCAGVQGSPRPKSGLRSVSRGKPSNARRRPRSESDAGPGELSGEVGPRAHLCSRMARAIVFVISFLWTDHGAQRDRHISSAHFNSTDRRGRSQQNVAWEFELPVTAV